MPAIPEYIIDQVRDRTDIAEVISRYIPLKKAGRNYKAVCPFHHEKTPSFMVSPVKQIYHCFGCGAGGNVFNFLMKYERIEFPEAVRELAQKAGVAIPQATAPSREKSSLSERLHAINEMATSFYFKNLVSTGDATAPRGYLNKRKIGPGVIEKFKLGYAPKLWDGLLAHLKKKGYEETLLERSGMIIKGKDGRYFDRFRNRLIFPIFDAKGKVKGFGSRVLDESQPKYMNSPETFIYNKGNHLYGLNSSWEEIRNKNAAVVVEGYVDFITPYQHGIKNIVASLGTALTVDQIRLLKRYTDNIIILFDADQAGENAAIRSLDLLVEEDIKVRIAQLPKGFDPDSFINKYGADRFKGFLDESQDIFDYKLNFLLKRYDSKMLDDKAKIANEMLPLISRIKNAILQSGYLKRLAEILFINELDLKKELKKVKPDYTYRYQPVTKEAWSSKSNMAEKILAGLMLEDSLFIPVVKKDLDYADFKDHYIKKIVERLYHSYDTKRKISPSKLIDCFKEDEDVCSCISELIVTCENLVDKSKSLQDCIKWIKQCGFREKLKMLSDQIKDAQSHGEDAKVVDLVIQYNDTMKTVKK